MDFKHLAGIDKQENAINHTITIIEQTILNLNYLLDTVMSASSQSSKFRRLPAQFQVTLTTFTPQEINKE